MSSFSSVLSVLALLSLVACSSGVKAKRPIPMAVASDNMPAMAIAQRPTAIRLTAWRL